MNPSQDVSGVQYAFIDVFPNYRFGDDGSVWTRWVKYSHPPRLGPVWQLVKQHEHKPQYYLFVTLIDAAGKRRNVPVNRVILWAFSGCCPRGYQSAHLDGFRQNNRASNLAWKTPRENSADKFLHGTVVRGTQVWTAILNEDQVREIRGLLATVSVWKISRIYKVCPHTIYCIAKGRTWKHVS